MALAGKSVGYRIVMKDDAELTKEVITFERRFGFNVFPTQQDALNALSLWGVRDSFRIINTQYETKGRLI